jgi:transcriptional regulator with XRE-family HTH domain
MKTSKKSISETWRNKEIMDKPKMIDQLFRKKLGILIRNAREINKFSREECAQVTGVSSGEFESFETGENSLSLPQLEIIAFFLNIPLSHFLGSTLYPEKTVFPDESDLQTFYELRHKKIAAKLKSLREDKQLTPEQMLKNSQLTEEEYLAFETCEKPVPLQTLNSFAYVLGVPLRLFLAESGKIGNWHHAQKAVKTLAEIPNELEEFLTNPSNEPYLRLAMHLSKLSADRLRAIAEGLLEITY